MALSLSGSSLDGSSPNDGAPLLLYSAWPRMRDLINDIVGGLGDDLSSRCSSKKIMQRMSFKNGLRLEKYAQRVRRAGPAFS